MSNMDPGIEVEKSDHIAVKQSADIGESALLNKRLISALVISFAVHGILMFSAKNIEVREEGQMSESVYKIPERVARLIMDKPRKPEPVVGEKKVKKETLEDKIAKETDPEKRKKLETKQKEVRKKAAKQAVAKRASRIQEKLRNTGVLAMLTGVGTTKSRIGPVVDVLKGTRGSFGDLDQKLKLAGNLVAAGDVEKTRSMLASRELTGGKSLPDIGKHLEKLKSGSAVSLEKLGKITITKPARMEGAAVSSAKRNEAVLKKVVQSQRVSIQSSYRRLLKRNPGLSGKITFRFTILFNGTVDDIEVLENTTGSDELAESILRRIARWKFPPIPEDQGSLRLSYPFVFQPG